MSLIVHNLTDEELCLRQLKNETKNKLTVVSSAETVTVQLENRPHFRKRRMSVLAAIGGEKREYEIALDRRCTRKGLPSAVVDEALPWRVYWRKDDKSVQQLVFVRKRNLGSFMSDMPDELPLSVLCLPGTHDTMAFYGWPFFQCQSPLTFLEHQLLNGVRVLDIRLAVVDNRLIAFHSTMSQRMPFEEILRIVHAFLSDAKTGARETIVMSIKQEDFEKTPPPIFSEYMHKEIYEGAGGRGMWFLENRVPHLAEVRGKVVMLSRFGGDGAGWDNRLEGMGIHPTRWPDSAKSGFSWQCKETLVRTHDWYAIPSFLDIPEKVDLATAILLPLPPSYPPVPTLNLTYISAANVPLALPTTVARGFGWPRFGLGVEGVNSRVFRWLFQQLLGEGYSRGMTEAGASAARSMDVERNSSTSRPTSVCGWMMMDFFAEPQDGAIAPLLIEFNYLSRS